MNLKWLLVRRIAAVGLACLAAGALVVIYQSTVRAKQQNVELVSTIGREMDRRLSGYASAQDIPERFPDWDLVTTPLLQSGQCVGLRAPDAELKHLNCAALDRTAVSAPAWFVWLYRKLAGDAADASASRALTYRDVTHGSVSARYEPIASASLAWASIAPLLAFSAALIAAVWLVTFFVIDRALQPTKQIVAGLNRMARGDLTLKLPAFRLSEFNRISEVFNYVSHELGKATAERSALARRLVDAQERERRHIARELHDEIAQKLSALNAHAAVLRTKAEREASSFAVEAKELERVITELMLTVRRTLTHLRPQEIDDLGLIPSIEALISQHNERADGKTGFILHVQKSLPDLTAETNAHVYRIVQEALTNAAKHANARHVQVFLNQSQGGESDIAALRLRVVDDGGSVHDGDRNGRGSQLGSGAGLVGMRERVAALSGTLAAGPRAEGGFALEVEFPISQPEAP